MFVGMNYINGSFQSHRSDFPSLNPSNDETIGFFPQSKMSEIELAVNSAKKAFSSWKNISRPKRGEYLDNLAQLIKSNFQSLIEVISLETGKNKNESLAEVNEALHMCQWASALGRLPYGELIGSELAEKDAYVLRKPKGVVGVISPWNFPMAIGGFWTSAVALAEGNTVVWKPSEETPICAQEIINLYDKAGFPEGVINLVHGDGDVGSAIVASKDVDCILFTGSFEVGKSIRQMCAEYFNKTCTLEMGSKSAVIVCDDLTDDLFNLAIEACVASAFKLSGQRCVSAGRLLIQRNIFDRFKNVFLEKVSELKVGSPENTDNYFGPLINRSQVSKVEYYNELVRKDPNATVLINGIKLPGPGNFMTPFVYSTEWRNVPYLRNEVFGPHCGLVPFDTIDDAIRIYNDTPYGLSVSVISQDLKVFRHVMQNVDAPLMYFNSGCVGAESHLPFSGMKHSGYGSGSATSTVEATTTKISATINYGSKIKWAQGMK